MLDVEGQGQRSQLLEKGNETYMHRDCSEARHAAQAGTCTKEEPAALTHGLLPV